MMGGWGATPMGELETNGAEGKGGRTKGLVGVGRAGEGFPVVEL